MNESYIMILVPLINALILTVAIVLVRAIFHKNTSMFRTYAITYLVVAVVMIISFMMTQESMRRYSPTPLIVSAVVVFLLLKVIGRRKSGMERQMNSGVIKETKCTCQACGNIWYYRPGDRLQNLGKMMINDANEQSNASSDILCCSGCALPLFMPKHSVRNIQDLHKCNKCNSSAVVKETVTHVISR